VGKKGHAKIVTVRNWSVWNCKF